jgi:hypothetical protein
MGLEGGRRRQSQGRHALIICVPFLSPPAMMLLLGRSGLDYHAIEKNWKFDTAEQNRHDENREHKSGG